MATVIKFYTLLPFKIILFYHNVENILYSLYIYVSLFFPFGLSSYTLKKMFLTNNYEQYYILSREPASGNFPHFLITNDNFISHECRNVYLRLAILRKLLGRATGSLNA